MSLPQPLIIIGGGEHARVVAEVAGSQPDQWSIAGFVDPKPCPETCARLGVPQLGSDEEALRAVDRAVYVLGLGRIGSAALRRNIVATYAAAGARWARVIHAGACVSRHASVGEGVMVGAGAVINTGAVVGAHVIVNTGSIVEHDVQLGPFAILGPGTVLGGGVEVGADAYLGLGARVRDHVSIGTGATVGMGAVVVKSLPAGVLAMGVPARVQPNLKRT